MVEYAISVIALVLGFMLGYAVRAAISARRRRKASRYYAREWQPYARPARQHRSKERTSDNPTGSLNSSIARTPSRAD